MNKKREAEPVFLLPRQSLGMQSRRLCLLILKEKKPGVKLT